MNAREETERYSSVRDKLFALNLKALFPQYGDLVNFLHPDEVFHADGEDPSEDVLREKTRKYIYFRRKLYLSGDQENLLRKYSIRLVDSLNSETSQEIRGTITFKGIIRGTVRLIFTEKDLKKVKSGEIIVSPMTRPGFLPVMKRASAFITDEGGITCHTAIVAREMRKPCIIGTQNATKLLKDGNLVEVNANDGIVKILNG